MWHLIKYRFIQITRNRPMMFWALAFPIILGTLFYISFGNTGVSATGDSDWDPVPVAVINKLDTKSSETAKTSEQDILSLTTDADTFSNMEGMSSGTFFADFLNAMNGEILDMEKFRIYDSCENWKMMRLWESTM